MLNAFKKKYSVFIIIFTVVFFTACFFLGVFFERRGNNSEIISAQETIEKLTNSIVRFETAIKSTKSELKNLEQRKLADEKTIREIQFSNNQLEASSRKFAEIIARQKKLIDKLGESNIELGESSDTVTVGLEDAIKTIDSLIEELQKEND